MKGRATSYRIFRRCAWRGLLLLRSTPGVEVRTGRAAVDAECGAKTHVSVENSLSRTVPDISNLCAPSTALLMSGKLHDYCCLETFQPESAVAACPCGMHGCGRQHACELCMAYSACSKEKIVSRLHVARCICIWIIWALCELSVHYKRFSSAAAASCDSVLCSLDRPFTSPSWSP